MILVTSVDPSEVTASALSRAPVARKAAVLSVVPLTMQVGEALSGSATRRACGDWFEAVAYAVPVVLVIAGQASLAVLLPLASAPLALSLYRVVHAGGDPRRLNPVLKQTARLSFVFSLLLAVGLALEGLF